jgi:hypothetical protein
MVNNVLTQRFNFFEISLYRDYSVLSSKPEKKKAESIELETQGIDKLFLFLEDENNNRVFHSSHTLYLHNKKEGKKKNTKYFYCEDGLNDEKVRISPLGTFYTQDEDKLKKYYGNPFASIKTSIYERTINMSDDKISIRFSRFEKTRQVNCKYFRKHSYSMGVSMNLKTGNIVIYQGDKKAIKIRQNSFLFLKDVLKQFLNETKTCVGFFLGDKPKRAHKINDKFIEVFNDKEFNDTLFHVLSSKVSQPDTLYFINPKTITDFAYKGFVKLFVQTNNIKVPNDYEDLMLQWYPTKPYLKKNENKLIVSILDRIGLKSKSIIRLVHANPKIDISKLTLLGKYFGYSNVHKYIHNITPEYFKDNWKLFDDQTNIESMFSVLNERFEYDIKDTERSVLLKLINQFFNEPEIHPTSIKHQIGQFNDHLDLITRIRKHIPEMEIRCQNLKDFHHEHIELSKIERSIKKGYSIQYTFKEDLIKRIEEVITQDDEDFCPIILKTDGQYTEEGAHMHHCVATYADRENSIIVSIRESSAEGHERVTCEFNLQKELVQAKYFCNAVPPERFEAIIEKLTHRIKKYKGSIKSLGKEKIPLVINGKVIQIEERKEDSIYEMLFNREPQF